MKPETEKFKKSTLNVQLFIFLFLASLYIITTAGYPSTSMGVSALATAISLIEEGDFALDEPTLETGVGKDGKYYCNEHCYDIELQRKRKAIGLIGLFIIIMIIIFFFLIVILN